MVEVLIYIFAGIGVAATLVLLGCVVYLFVFDPVSTR